MRVGAIIIASIIAFLMILGFLIPLVDGKSNGIDPNFLLTVIATTGALGGIAFALYGWFTSREIPKMVDKAVTEKIDKLMNELNERFYRQQESMQKVLTSYQLQDPDAKIDLLKRAIEQDETVYNLYITLGYVYWYDKNDFSSAEECFRKDLSLHTDNYQAACDLSVLNAQYGEYRTALRWMKETLRIHPESILDFENDKRFDPVREHLQNEYERMVDTFQ